MPTTVALARFDFAAATALHQRHGAELEELTVETGHGKDKAVFSQAKVWAPTAVLNPQSKPATSRSSPFLQSQVLIY